MWTYEKRLQYPVKIKKCDPNMAALIISQFGGPDGELAASQRYLSQRYSVPYGEVAGLLTDIGTYIDHTTGLWPAAASGAPFSATVFQSKGDPITDLTEDMAAEQKARTTYDNILRLVDDPDVREPIKFLREREIVHFQRFGEGLRIVQDNLNSKNFYAFNPSFD